MLTKAEPLPPTEEQEAIYDAVADDDSNHMISALAGTGKTATLKGIQTKFPPTKPFQTRHGPRNILYLVFNANNALEAMSLEQMRNERKAIKDGHSEDPKDRMLPTTDVMTLNGCGHRIWMSGGRTLKLDGRKTVNIFKEILTSFKTKFERDRAWATFDLVSSGVAFAKALGYIPEGALKSEASLVSQSTFHSALEEIPDDFVSDLIDAVLRKSIVLAYSGLIDFNDQIYMPALFGGVVPKYPRVMVDEYQDLCPTNHALLARLVTNRLVGVGDPWQNIYAFRGATARGMLDAVSQYSMSQHNLSVSFRCPSAIVEHVHWRVPHFKAFKTGGAVHTPDKMPSDNIPDDATFICRNNAPLFALAFRLISIGHSVTVSGSEIGPKLVGIMKRLGNLEMSKPQTLNAIADWEAEKLANESTTATDMAECMRIFTRKSDSLGLAISYAEHLFKQEGSIKLMTGHKSKGLQFQNVFHLDPHLLGDSEQDKNLRYVISTRSQNTLTEISSDGIQW